MGKHIGRDLPRGAAELASKRQRAVGLEVGVLRASHDWVHALTGDRLKGVCEPINEKIFQVRHD